MKKYLFLFFTVLTVTNIFAQSAEVVVTTRGKVVGLLSRTNAKTYTVLTQDDFEVPKAGHKVVVFSAENGQGFVICKNWGSVNVRSTPSTSGKKVGSLTYEEGYVPDPAECLGKKNGWYKIRLENGVVGYVRQDLVEWVAIYTG